MTEQQPVAIDTSFWTVGHRADVLQYLVEYFMLHAPPAVRREILAVDPVYPRRIYGYVAMFRAFEEFGALEIVTPSRPVGQFGAGEAEALALAQERGWWLLINDHRPYTFARRLGLQTTSVPSFIAYLYELEVLSLTSAERKLDLITAITSPTVIDPARQAIDCLARERGARQ